MSENSFDSCIYTDNFRWFDLQIFIADLMLTSELSQSCSQRQIEWFHISDWNRLHYPNCDESLWLIRVWNVHTSTVNSVVVI